MVSALPQTHHIVSSLFSPQIFVNVFLASLTHRLNLSTNPLRDADQVLLHNLVLVSGVLRGTGVLLYSWSGEERSHWGVQSKHLVFISAVPRQNK